MRHIFVMMLLLCCASTASADPLLADLFNNNILATSTQLNGGFYIIGSGSGNVLEAGGVASITNSANKNDTYGILSSNTVSMSSIAGATTMITRWEASNSDLKDKASLMAYTWQTADSLTDTPSISVIIDMNNTNISLYIGDSDISLGSIELSADFGAPGDAFSLVATFTSGNFIVSGEGDLVKKDGVSGDILFHGSWGVTPRSFEDYHLGAVVTAKGNNGLIVNLDSVTVDAIPEPAVISLIGIFGGGMIFSRRIFGRKKSDSDA